MKSFRNVVVSIVVVIAIERLGGSLNYYYRDAA